jgi:hypothetical protein
MRTNTYANTKSGRYPHSETDPDFTGVAVGHGMAEMFTKSLRTKRSSGWDPGKATHREVPCWQYFLGSSFSGMLEEATLNSLGSHPRECLEKLFIVGSKLVTYCRVHKGEDDRSHAWRIATCICVVSVARAMCWRSSLCCRILVF